MGRIRSFVRVKKCVIASLAFFVLASLVHAATYPEPTLTFHFDGNALPDENASWSWRWWIVNFGSGSRNIFAGFSIVLHIGKIMGTKLKAQRFRSF